MVNDGRVKKIVHGTFFKLGIRYFIKILTNIFIFLQICHIPSKVFLSVILGMLHTWHYDV